MNLKSIVEQEREVSLRSLDNKRDLIFEIQDILIDIGCLDPEADGDFGPISSLALKAFCEHVGIIHNDESLTPVVAKALLDVHRDTFIPLKLDQRLESRIIRFMDSKKFWFARLPRYFTIVYLEGAKNDGEPNANSFNQFNDRRVVIGFEDGKPKIFFNALATTEPGEYYTTHPLNPLGAARIAFGQYKAWRVGTHKAGTVGQHEALIQVANVKVHRDLNQDGKRIGDKIDVGSNFGINQHSGHNAPENNIGKASAGCLVGRTDKEHVEFMELIKSDIRYSVGTKGYRFMTTIIDAKDLEAASGIVV